MPRSLASTAALLLVMLFAPCGCGSHTNAVAGADASIDGAADGSEGDAAGPPSLDAGPQDAGPTCATLCPNGCCNADGCQVGTATSACGFGGQACSDCSTAGLTCIAALGANPGGSCGSTAPEDGGATCGPASCSGCCTEGSCIAGNTGSQCGSHGQACLACDGLSVTCQAQGNGGTCVGSGACTPSNCAGCCDVFSVCQNPTDVGACGSGGLSCTYCDPGEACFNGSCQAVSGCNAANCVGCCQGDVCESGVSDGACGSNGAACAACDPSSPSSQCLPVGLKNGGACSSPSDTCSAATCAGGCCDSSGFCHTYTSFYCGPQGAGSGDECTTCNGTCIGGVCAGTDCNASNCTGCCMPDGTCWNGAVSDEHCGASSPGSLCIDCGTGYRCDLSAAAPENPSCVLACSLDGDGGDCGN